MFLFLLLSGLYWLYENSGVFFPDNLNLELFLKNRISTKPLAAHAECGLGSGAAAALFFGAQVVLAVGLAVMHVLPSSQEPDPLQVPREVIELARQVSVLSDGVAELSATAGFSWTDVGAHGDFLALTDGSQVFTSGVQVPGGLIGVNKQPITWAFGTVPLYGEMPTVYAFSSYNVSAAVCKAFNQGRKSENPAQLTTTPLEYYSLNTNLPGTKTLSNGITGTLAISSLLSNVLKNTLYDVNSECLHVGKGYQVIAVISD